MNNQDRSKQWEEHLTKCALITKNSNRVQRAPQHPFTWTPKWLRSTYQNRKVQMWKRFMRSIGLR